MATIWNFLSKFNLIGDAFILMIMLMPVSGIILKMITKKGERSISTSSLIALFFLICVGSLIIYWR